MFLGDYLTIERQIGPFEFECRSVSTGTPFIARVDEDKQELFADRSWIEGHSTACPFLRPLGNRIVCTIHETSPFQWKAYQCLILYIFAPYGREVGRVNGTFGLITDDPELRSVGGEGEMVIDWWAEDVEEHICRFLQEKGYHIV